MLRLCTNSDQETMDFAASVAAHLAGGECLTLDGPLGAGKTCFVRGLARGMGIDPSVISSPTFVIRQDHAAPLGLTLVHMDAYRLRSADDLASIGFDELLRDLQCGQDRGVADVVVAIEWPSRIAAALPADRLDLTFEHAAQSTRVISMRGSGSLIDLPSVLRAAMAAESAIRCHSCKRAVASDTQWFPFCSERCRLADLNAWFTGAYRMSRQAESDEELTE